MYLIVIHAEQKIIARFFIKEIYSKGSLETKEFLVQFETKW